MKKYHDPKTDFLSIDFTDEVEEKSVYQDGIIIRYNKKGNVIGIDITDSTKVLTSPELLNLKEACSFLDISESTMRRKIRNNEIKFIKKGKEYRFKRSDLLKIVA